MPRPDGRGLCRHYLKIWGGGGGGKILQSRGLFGMLEVGEYPGRRGGGGGRAERVFLVE